MNHRQIEKNGMYKKLLLFFANPLNIAIWTGFARLLTEIANFVALNVKLTNYLQLHYAEIKGVTQVKNDAFMAMVKIVVNKASKASVWAMDTSNANLMEIFDIGKWDFVDMPEVTAFAKIKNVRDALSANITAMANVQLVAADITAINAAITAYQNTIGTTGSAQARKTEATQAIEDIIPAIEKSLLIIDKLIVSSYSTSNVDMVKEYLLNRNVAKLPTHHSGIWAHITDTETGLDLEGAILSVNGKSATSDIDGIVEISKIKPNTYNVCAAFPGYISQNMKNVIERGKVTELEVKLVKE